MTSAFSSLLTSKVKPIVLIPHGAEKADDSIIPRFLVATVPEKQLVSFLRDLGVPGACILGSPQWQTPEELEGLTLYYIMTSSAVHSLCLTERWGGLADWMERPNEYEAILHPSLRTQDWGFSRLADICLNDVPAIQSFLVSILTDANFFHRKDPFGSSPPTSGSPKEVAPSRRFLSGDHLIGKPYAIILEADALHLILPRIEPQPARKINQIVPEPAPPGAGTHNQNRTEAIHDIYVLRPSFSTSQRLICTITYLQTEPADIRRRLRRKEESLPLPCTPKEIISLIRNSMEGRSKALLLFDCLPCLRCASRRLRLARSSSLTQAINAGLNGSRNNSRTHSSHQGSAAKNRTSNNSNQTSPNRSNTNNSSLDVTGRQANALKAMELITVSRLLGSQMFGRLIWQKMIGVCDPVSLSLLRCTVFPVELSLAKAITSNTNDVLDPCILITALQDLLAVPAANRPRGFKNDNFKHLCLAMLEVISANTSKEALIRSAIRVINEVPMMHQACIDTHATSSIVRMYYQARAIRDGGLARRIAAVGQHSGSDYGDAQGNRVRGWASASSPTGSAGDLGVHLYSFLLLFEVPDEESERGADSENEEEDSDNEENDGAGRETSSTFRDEALVKHDESTSRSSPHRVDTKSDTFTSSRGGSSARGSTTGPPDSQRGLKTKMAYPSKLKGPPGSARKVGSTLGNSIKHDHSPPNTGEKRRHSSNSEDKGRDNSTAEIENDNPPNKAKPLGPLARVPKLSIMPTGDSDLGAGALNTGGGGGGGSTGSSRRPHSTSTGTTPFTTRSSRRYFASKAPSTNPHRGRTPSTQYTYISSSTRTGSLSSTHFTMMDAAKTATAPMTNSNTEEPVERSLTRLTSLARKLGQTYLASDLWVVLEMHQREMSDTSSPSAKDRGSGSTRQSEEDGDDEGDGDDMLFPRPLTLIPRDKHKSNVISPTLSFWVVRDTTAPLFSKEVVDAFTLLSSGSVQGTPLNLLTLLSELLDRDPRIVTADDWVEVAGLTVSEFMWEKDVGPLPEKFTRVITSLHDLLSSSERRAKDNLLQPLSSTPIASQDTDPVVSCIEKRMLVLVDLQEGIIKEEKNMGVEAPGLLRKRWGLIQRFIACERTMHAQILARHVERRMKESQVNWSFVMSVMTTCVRCLNTLRICNQSLRERNARTSGAITLEEAGLAFWLLQALNRVFDYCNHRSSLSSKLLQELHSSINYVSTMRELFISLMWEVQANGGLELEISLARGETIHRSEVVEEKEPHFCTTSAVARMQLAFYSHMNRSIDLCRTTLRRYKRYDDGERSGDENRGAVRDIVGFFHQLNYFFAVDMVKLSTLLTYYSPMSGDHRSPLKRHSVGDRACIPIGAMWILSKMLAMDDDRHLMPQDWVDSVIFFHFTAFLMLYASVKEDRKKMLLCKAHLRMLLALASYRNPFILDKFFQLRVLNFFVQEISTEMLMGGVTEEASGKPPLQSSYIDRDPIKLSLPPKALKGKAILPVVIPSPTVGTVPEEAALHDASAQLPPSQPNLELRVDDRVDGLVTLKNGRQRWFPAKITGASPDGSFSLLYDDGDTEIGKAIAEIRASRSRKVAPSPSASGRTINSSPKKSTTNSSPLPEAVNVKSLSLPCSLGSSRKSSQESPQPFNMVSESAALPRAVILEANKLSLDESCNLLNTTDSLDVHSVDSESDLEDSEIFDIPPALVPEGGGLRQSSSLPAMKLQLSDASMAAIRPAKGQMLGASLSASLLCGGEDMADSDITYKSGLGGDERAQPPGASNDGHESSYPRQLDRSNSLEGKYSTQRERIALYKDPQLHELAVLLVLNLCISSDRLALEPRYCTQFPATGDGGYETAGNNVLFVLYCHLNHPDNAQLAPRLRAHVPQFGKAAVRLLRLLCNHMFDAKLYSQHKEKIAEGGFGTVMAIRSPVAMGGVSTAYLDSPIRPAADAHLTVKLIGHETSQHDRCATFDVFSEISALEALRHSSHVCHLYDYGVSDNKFWLVMERCQFSLRTWRVEQMPLQPTDDHVMIYLQIFAKVLEAVHTLHDHNIAHFDLKCDNVFIRAIDGPGSGSDGGSSGSFSNPFQLPFSICIGDFGEAQIGTSSPTDRDQDEEEAGSRSRVLQARGTEAVQSPEMVRIMAINRKDMAGYDRRKRRPVGCSSDVWSLGCLVYELLTGEFLFNSDWSQFFVQLTNPSLPMPPSDRMEPLKATLSPSVFSTIQKLLEYMLVREVERRPRLDHVRSQLQLLLQALTRKILTSSSSAGILRDGNTSSLLLTPPAPRRESTQLSTSGATTTGTQEPARPLDVWAGQGEGEVPAGLWRLAARAYITAVSNWGSFFRSKVDVDNVMSDEGGLPSTWDLDDDLKISTAIEENLVFSGRFLPDIWHERPWIERQCTRAQHLGVTKLVILVELDEKICKPSLPRAGVSLVEVDEAEKLILRASRSRTPPGQSKARGPDTPQSKEEAEKKKPPGSAPQPQGLLVFWKSSSTTEDTISEEVISTLLETPKYTERIMDFLLRREDKDERPVIALVTAAGPRKTLSNVVVTALSTLYVMRESEMPLCLYEAILRVKSCYPDATLTQQTVACLSKLRQARKGRDGR